MLERLRGLVKEPGLESEYQGQSPSSLILCARYLTRLSCLICKMGIVLLVLQTIKQHINKHRRVLALAEAVWLKMKWFSRCYWSHRPKQCNESVNVDGQVSRTLITLIKSLVLTQANSSNLINWDFLYDLLLKISLRSKPFNLVLSGRIFLHFFTKNIFTILDNR